MLLEITGRRITDSLKWCHYSDNVVPLWVADMDFAVSGQIQKALANRIEHPVFGYTLPSAKLESVLIKRLHERYGVMIEKEWIIWLPGCVSGFNVAARAFCSGNGSEVLTNIPAYPPFLQCGENNDCRIVPVSLGQDDRRWIFDFDAIKAQITQKTNMFLLCSPHNPTGRLWERSELEELSRVCLENKLIICSDEIHCDLILERNRSHIPMFSLSDEVAQNSITLMSPSKTFNIAGLNCAFALIPNKKLRKKYRQAMAGLVPYVNTFGYVGALAAYRDSEGWLSDVLERLRENYTFVFERIEMMQGLEMSPVEATYLAWIDAREMRVKNPYGHFLRHGVALSDGALFGMPGFVRLNFACSRDTLQQGLKCMEKALLKNGE